VTLTLRVSGQAYSASIDGTNVAVPYGQITLRPNAAGTFQSRGVVRGPGGATSCSAVFSVWQNNIVQFRIPRGTGNKPWNLAEKPVEAKVGQILRIINDDTTPHKLFTGGKGCANQTSTMTTNTYFDCVLKTTVDPIVDKFYDVNFGETARFYVRATN
jgi:hypothetical protein